jgi:CheY-like chemotaxis protein
MTREDFIAALRTALMQLDDFNSLRNSPLLLLLAPAGHSPSPVTLQDRLVSAIHELRYASGTNAQRSHDILYYRYVEHLPQLDVAFQFGISERQLRREQANAIELLAERLWQAIPDAERSLPENVPPPAAGQAAAPARTDDQSVIDTEMDWLRQQLPPGSCQVEEALAKVVGDVAALAANYHVQITCEYSADLGTAAVPPVALRQSVLTVMTAIVPKIVQQTLRVAARRTTAEVQVLVELSEPGAAIDDDCASRIRIAHQILSPFGGRVELHGPHPSHVALYAPTVSSVPVLVVDDNPDATELVQRYAQGSRFRVVTTNDGRETLRLACEDEVKAILIDIMMPQIDGWDLLATLRHHPATQAIPVAVCSVLPQHELSDVLGARMFIQKPLTQEVFLKALDVLTSAAQRPAPARP